MSDTTKNIKGGANGGKVWGYPDPDPERGFRLAVINAINSYPKKHYLKVEEFWTYALFSSFLIPAGFAMLGTLVAITYSKTLDSSFFFFTPLVLALVWVVIDTSMNKIDTHFLSTKIGITPKIIITVAITTITMLSMFFTMNYFIVNNAPTYQEAELKEKYGYSEISELKEGKIEVVKDGVTKTVGSIEINNEYILFEDLQHFDEQINAEK